MHDPGDPLALLHPLALEQHLLLARQAGPGQVDGQAHEPAEQHEEDDVVHGGLARRANLDEVGQGDDPGREQPAAGAGHDGAARPPTRPPRWWGW